MKLLRAITISFIVGYTLAFLSGLAIYELNRQSYPEIAEPWRLMAWIILFGIFFSWMILDIMQKELR